MSKINWNNCFSLKRFGASENSQKENRSEFEVDWDRIIFSSPFRRLQNKTQVFPLPEEIFVHNRLTHSLEVASVGRSLGAMIGAELTNHDSLTPAARLFYLHDLKSVIAAACLAHDLGNPAFGHSGEEAISMYFKKRNTEKLEDVEFKKLFSSKEWCDLMNFEGNANALRILTLHKNGKFQLTYSTLAAILKYPCESSATGKHKGIHRKKFGFFQADKDTFQNIVQELNMIRDESEPEKIVYKRHPFVFIVEAADDICYNIIDLEDAHRLGILSFEEVKKLFIEIIESEKPMSENANKILDSLQDDPNEAVAYLRAKAIGKLVNFCKTAFLDHKNEILQGEWQKSLLDSVEKIQITLENIRHISLKRIYNHIGVVKLEIAGFRIMYSLVEDFVLAALTSKNLRNKEQQKVMELLPSQFQFQEEDSPYQKTMKILDFISGMTDLFALKLYRNLRGIEL